MPLEAYERELLKRLAYVFVAGGVVLFMVGFVTYQMGALAAGVTLMLAAGVTEWVAEVDDER